MDVLSSPVPVAVSELQCDMSCFTDIEITCDESIAVWMDLDRTIVRFPEDIRSIPGHRALLHVWNILGIQPEIAHQSFHHVSFSATAMQQEEQ